MTDLKSSLKQFVDLLIADDVKSRHAELEALVTELTAAFDQHNADLRSLMSRVEKLELGLVYMDRGCGA